jgi:ribosomal protein S17E
MAERIKFKQALNEVESPERTALLYLENLIIENAKKMYSSNELYDKINRLEKEIKDVLKLQTRTALILNKHVKLGRPIEALIEDFINLKSNETEKRMLGYIQHLEKQKEEINTSLKRINDSMRYMEIITNDFKKNIQIKTKS